MRISDTRPHPKPTPALQTRLRTLLFSVLLTLLFSAQNSEAQFVRIGPLTFAAPDGKTGVVLVPSDGTRGGIFIFTDPRGRSAQGMNPLTTPSDTAASVFLNFNPVANSYDQLLVGDQGYRLQGSLTLKIGDARVQIDTTAPYISIVTGNAQKPHILGLSGIEPVLNRAGIESATLYEGNQFSDEGGQPVVPIFTVQRGSKLSLDGKPFDGPRIGILPSIQNRCVDTPGVVVVVPVRSQPSLAGGADTPPATESTPNSEGKKLDRFLRIVTTQEWIAALDFESGKLGIIREVSQSDPVSCAFTESAA